VKETIKIMICILMLFFISGCIDSATSSGIKPVMDEKWLFNISDDNVLIEITKSQYTKNENIKARFLPKKEGIFLLTHIPYFGSGFTDSYVKIYQWDDTRWKKLQVSKYSGSYSRCKNGRFIEAPLGDNFRFYNKIELKSEIKYEWNQKYYQMVDVFCEGKKAKKIIVNDVPIGKYKLGLSYVDYNPDNMSYTDLNETQLEIEFEIIP